MVTRDKALTKVFGDPQKRILKRQDRYGSGQPLSFLSLVDTCRPYIQYLSNSLCRPTADNQIYKTIIYNQQDSQNIKHVKTRFGDTDIRYSVANNILLSADNQRKKQPRPAAPFADHLRDQSSFSGGYEVEDVVSELWRVGIKLGL